MSPLMPNTEAKNHIAHKCIHVAVGIIRNRQGEFLVSQRQPGVRFGGLWEFPGGKQEPGESMLETLKRELAEELGIYVLEARPFMTCIDEATSITVILSVWVVLSFEGQPISKEGQPIRWVDAQALLQLSMPPANTYMVNRLTLSENYFITPEPQSATLDEYIANILSVVESHQVSLMQIRAHSLNDQDYAYLVKNMVAEARALGARVLINRIDFMSWLELADGCHLQTHVAQSLSHRSHRPFVFSKLLGVSCHSLEQLQKSVVLKADFAVLSPVKKTLSHPQAEPLGWRQFSEMVLSVELPVYALGGIGFHELAQAKAAGAYGIAGMRAYS